MEELKEVTEILNRFGGVIASQLKDDIKNKPATKYGPANASGKLADSVRFEVKDGRLKVYALDYIYYVENGRGPNKAPDKTGLYGIGNAVREKGELGKAIEKWVEVKLGIVEEKKRNSIAFLIARKIAREGTEAKKQGGTKLLEDILSPELINQIKKEILELFKGNAIRELKSAITGLKQAA